jgi:hypothetical protein
VTGKIAPASAEEYTFAQEVNRLLVGTGASVHAFTRVTDDGAKSYALIFQCGGRRTERTADAPFHYDPPEEVVRTVREWMAGAGGDRWTTDLEAADADI